MRRVLATVLIVMFAGAGIATFGILSAPIVTDADFAVGELYTELATRAQLFVGPYSRFGWHHPGPLYFYVAAPFYALSGHRAATLYAVALAINLAAIGLIGWVAARESRGPMGAVLIGACALLSWRLTNYLASPWTGHVAVLASVGFLVAAAAVASGRWRWLPWLVAVGSFAVQTHVGFAPVVIGAGIGAIVAGFRGAAPASRPSIGVVAVSAVLLAALWSLPIVEAISHRGGNLAALWRFFVTDSAPGHPLREAILSGSYGLTGLLRPDLDLPWAGHFAMSLPWLSVAGIGLEIVLLLAIAGSDLRAGRRFEGCLAATALVATLLGILALTRVRGDILNHDLFRLTAIGTLNLAIILAMAFRVVSGMATRWIEPQRARRVTYTLLAVVVVVIGVRDLRSMTAFERRHQERSPIVPAFEAIRVYTAQQGVRKPIVRIDADRWGEAAGVLLRLIQNGTPVAVMPDHVPTFSTALAPTGDEDAIVTFANLELHRELRAQPETAVLLQSFPLFVDARRIAPGSDGR